MATRREARLAPSIGTRRFATACDERASHVGIGIGHHGIARPRVSGCRSITFAGGKVLSAADPLVGAAASAMSGLWAARGGATSAAAQDWLGPKADAARLMAADDGEDFREALITPVFQELAYVSAQRLNPWFQPWMYTKATDFMLDVVDGLEEGFAASSEGLVCLATGILLRYLGAHAIDSSKLEVTANLCLTIASKFNERMYVPLSRGAKHDVIEPSTGTVVARSALELEVLDRLGWRLNVVTPYALKRAALEAVLEQHELDATPEIYAQCWCAPRLPAWPPQYPPSTLGDCARNFSAQLC